MDQSSPPPQPLESIKDKLLERLPELAWRLALVLCEQIQQRMEQHAKEGKPPS